MGISSFTQFVVMPMTKTRPIKDDNVLIAIGAAPFRVVTRTYRYLSSVPGFALIAHVATTYCALLSIESVMVAMPVNYPIRADFATKADYKEEVELVKRQRRFVPKFAVNDGADVRRLLPIANIHNLLVNEVTKEWDWMPEFITARAKSDFWTVWNNPALFVLAASAAITIQRFEAVFLRKRATEATRAKFDEANKIKRVEADPKAIAVAAIRAEEHNRQGMGEIGIGYTGITLLYVAEIAAFLGSFSGSGNIIINLFYGLLTVAGFELFDRFTGDEIEEIVEVKAASYVVSQ